MLRRVRIKKLPQAKTGYQVRGSLYNDVPSMGGGADYNAYIGEPHLKASKYITAVPREEANLEAEGGETVFGDINGDGMPEHKTIKGPRHSEGGVPLKLPDDSFIFSDTKSMKMKEPNFLAMFGKKTGSYTPAELAKQYDVERYRKILQDPNSDMLDKKTAELMLKNYTLKLGALALAQESKKGFPQGIPAVARPYMEAMGIKDEDVLPDQQITSTIKELDQQQKNNQRSAATMASPTEEQDEEYGDEAEEAQMMNSDRPVATPEPMEDEAAGMTPEEAEMQFGGMLSSDRAFAFQNGGWLPEEVAVFTGTVPYAEYGMAMGVNPQNYEGRKKHIHGATRFFQNGGNLPKAQGGIEVDITGMTPQQRDKALDEARTKNPGKEINVIENGKKKSAKYKKLKAQELTDIEGVDMKTFGNTPNSVAAAAQYKLLEKNLKDPKVMNKLYEETISSLKDKRSYVGKDGVQGKTWEERGNALPSPAEVRDQFLTHQKRNLSFRGQNIDPNLFTDTGAGLAPAAELIKRGAINPKTGKKITNEEEAKEAKEHMRQTYGGGRKGYTKDGEIIDVSIDEVSGKIGIPLEKDEKSRALQQATFHGYTHMAENKGNYDADTQYALKNFIPESLQAGVGDEISMGKGLFKNKGVQISPIDDFYKLDDEEYKSKAGNTTLGHLAGAGLEEYTFEDINEGPCECEDGSKPQRKEDGTCPCETKPKGEKPCPCEKSDGTKIDVGVNPNTGECNPCVEEQPVDIEQPAEWWLQDTIKTAGAFGDLMSIKKHMPWAPRVDLETPRPTFLDPTRELAANAEQANIQTQAAAQFAGPQALSARASSIQGTAAKNAADVLSKYNNANVNIANQFETQATNIRNQEQMMNQAGTQRLYDQNTVANQQFDNAKLAMRSNLRNQYTNAITNRAKTAALNDLYPQYAVSPATGGFNRFQNPKDFTGEKTSTTKTYDEWLKYYIDQGNTPEQASTNAKNAVNTQASSGGTTDKAAMAKQMGYGAYGGQLKKGGFVYADVIYPFIL
jgi:hypothetical protein